MSQLKRVPHLRRLLPCALLLLGAAGAAHAAPLAFEPNLGQTAGEVAYFGRTSDGVLFLTPSEIVLRLSERLPPAEPALGEIATPPARPRQHVLRIQPVGASTPRLESEQPLDSRSSYYRAGAPAISDVPHFGRVIYRGIYPQTDLVVRGDDGRWAYDFVLAPAADPALIALRFAGSDATSIEADGSLRLDTPLGPVHQSAPFLYQEIGGEKMQVAGGFELRPDGLIGFTVGTYDRSRPLVIDPTISYRTCAGGAGPAFTYASGIASTPNGQAYFVGSTDGATFPHPGGLPDGWGQDAFVAKLDLAGNLSRATYFDLGQDEFGAGIALDASNNAVISGLTRDASGVDQAWVAKLGTLLDTVIWLRTFGGAGSESALDVAVDGSGNIFSGGYSDSTNFCSGILAGKCTLKTSLMAGDRDGFVVKFGPNGGVSWATLVGTNQYETGVAIAVDDDGRPYLGGYRYIPAVGGNPAVFPSWVTRLAANGLASNYTFHFGTTPDPLTGSTINALQDLAVDPLDNAYVTGFTNSRFLGTVGAVQPVYGGGTDAFVGMIDNSGSGLIYLTYQGGGGYETGSGIAAGDNRNAYVVGTRQDTDPASDVSIARYSTGGISRVFYSAFGGSASDTASAVALDSSRNMYVAGRTSSTDFDPGDPACTAASSVNFVAFAVKVLP